ncbi:MAG: Flp family type IVb pilin [Pirellulales bacterium]|nr:Flp family type IVb pilin [Pirellulales bacterium]
MLAAGQKFLREETGATAVEYAVMLALILVAVISAIGSVGAQTGGMWGTIDGDLTSHGFGS